MDKVKTFFKKIFGQIIFKISILGVQIFSITKVNSECFNVYVFYLPCFRIRKSQSLFCFNLLVLSWLYDFLKSFGISKTIDTEVFLFGEYHLIERIHNASTNALKVCNKNFYGVYRKEAFKFSTAKFKG